MGSPFSGVDPYLETRWRDVQTALVAGARAALNEDLPNGLVARAEERIAIESDSADQQYVPDVSVYQAVEKDSSTAVERSGDWPAPYRLVAVVEPIMERYIEIIDVTGERLVTVIEFVSPTNKRGEGLRDFVKKRYTLLNGGVNFVEIDLTRGGNWRELLLPHRCPARAISLYRAVVRRPAEATCAYLYPIELRKPVPSLPIPLRENDAPVELPMQKLIDEAYRTGRYDQAINYSVPPAPPLDESDGAWADELLRSAGKR